MNNHNKMIILSILATSSLLFAGCASNTSQNNNIEQLKQEIADLKKENEELRKQAEQPAPAEATPETQEAAPPAQQVNVIELNKTTTIADFSEFTVTKTAFAKKVTPPKPGTFYTYYEAKEAGTTYLDITIAVKSLLTSGKSSDEFASVSVKYNDKYTYDTFATIEDQGGADFTYTNITSIEPLKTGTLHFLAEVPVEVETGTEPVKAIIKVNDTEFEYQIR